MTQADYDADAKTIRLLDPKCRRAIPGEHHVQLIASVLRPIGNWPFLGLSAGSALTLPQATEYM
ncbi:MAG: hypothetical protein ACREPL_01155, partial [Rhodanobacteraceae bacterium]